MRDCLTLNCQGWDWLRLAVKFSPVVECRQNYPETKVWGLARIPLHYSSVGRAELGHERLTSHHLSLQAGLAMADGEATLYLLCLVQGELELVLIANEMKGFTSFHVCPWELGLRGWSEWIIQTVGLDIPIIRSVSEPYLNEASSSTSIVNNHD